MCDHPSMNDRTPTGRQQATNRRLTVTVSEAAAALGISPDAVRGRLQRGSLEGEKIKGTWHITLPTPSVPTGDQQATDGASTGHRQAIDGSPTGHQRDELVTHLEGEVTYLREQLDRALRQLEAERERTDVLTALSSGTSKVEAPHEAPESPQTSDPAPTGVLAWWKRLWGG
jgi:hypothetical protein